MESKILKSLNIDRLSFIQRKSIYKRPSLPTKNDQESKNKNLNEEILSNIQNLIKKNNEEDLIKINIDINNNFKQTEKNKKTNKKVNSVGLFKGQKYSISIKNHFKTERRNAIQRKIGLNIEIPNEIEVINSLLLSPHERNIEDLHRIAFFISGCSLINGLLDTAQKRQKDIEKLIYEISFRIKYKFVPENNILFRIGDVPDIFYIIIQGKVEILKPKKIIKRISGFEYFKILLKYQREEEYFLLNEVINLNFHLFEIDKDDLSILKLFLLKLELNEYFQSTGEIKGENIIKLINEYFCENEILNKIELNKNIIIDARNPNNRIKINLIKEKLYKLIPKAFSSKIKIYMKFTDKTNIKEITILKYSHIVKLKDKDFFGDTAFDTKSNRNATVCTLEDTHLCYLEKEHYEQFLKADKKSQRLSSIHFLLDNFFFKELSITTFESNFFSHFIYEEKIQNYILFEQFSPSDYLYFIKSGEIELSNKSSIIQIYYLTKHIYQLNLENNINKYINKIKNFEPRILAPAFKNNIFFLKKDLISKKNFFLFNILNKDVIGLESIIFDLPYLYNAKVISKSAVLFKIEKNVLFQLMKNYECLSDDMIKDGKKKMKLILDRFIENNTTLIKKLDNNLSKKIIYNKIKDDEIKQKNKINEAIKSLIKNKIHKVKIKKNEELNDLNKCYSEERKISIDVLGKKYSLFNLKKNNSYKTLVKLSGNINIGKKYIKNIKHIKLQNNYENIKINNKLLSDKINKYNEKKKLENFFFTQPIHKHSKDRLNKFNNNNEEIDINDSKLKSVKTEIDNKNNLLFKIDNNIISFNILNNKIKYPKISRNFHSPKNNNVPYLLKTFVNIEKIKKFKLNLKHARSSPNCLKKKIKIVHVNKKPFSCNKKLNK